VKFTEQGEIVLTIAIQPRTAIGENEQNPSHNTIIKKEALLIELLDTGIGMNPEYIQHAWKSFSQGDMSITKRQDGTGLGLSICKSLVEINGGEINAASQLGKGSKFWFTWNIELLSAMPTILKFPTLSSLEAEFNKQIIFMLPHTLGKKRILIIHPVDGVRNSILKYLKRIEKIDAFDTLDKGIRAAKVHKELIGRPAYDIVFIGLYENNKEEVMNAALELRELEINNNNLVITFIVSPNNEGKELAESLIEKIGGITFVIYTPITWKKLVNQFIHLEKGDAIYKNKSLHIVESVLKQVPNYRPRKIKDENQDIYRDIILSASKSITRNVTRSKCILCVDGNSVSLENTLKQVSKLGYSTVFATNGQEAVRLINSEFKILNDAYSSSSSSDINSCGISLILTECNLPIMSGFDVSRAIRAMGPPISDIPIIVLTTLSMKEIQGKCIESGINDYLAKPLKTDELEKALTKWI
ncbi:22022_t:CDS:2, partial [Racocetra persica]